MAKVLVTGGAGFIGGNFIHYLLDVYSDMQVVCLDALTYAGNIHTLDTVQDNRNFVFYREDITHKDAVEQLFARYHFDAVINFAAETHVDRSIEDPAIFLKTNILGTQVLMDACLKYGTQRFHQVSTDEVYGDLPIDRPDLLFREDTPLKASSPYSASKAAADLLVLSYVRTFGLPATLSRCSNNYGPYQFPEKLIPLMTIQALQDKQLPVYGQGTNVRDWLHVHDHCCALDRIICAGKTGQVYNIGGNNERSNIDVVRTILRTVNKPESLISYVDDRPGHDLRYAIDSTKMKDELGWSPSITFKDGIKRTIQWYVDNEAWWKPLADGGRHGLG